jgi:glycosyltransferase involved in cell wall biosynthesis
MSKQTSLKISIVIPVFNEADSLAACLDAIASQMIKPLEVIVVDNNSTDTSKQIAREYSFVKLLTERRQGVVFARDRGFDAAKGDIIARIDADTQIPVDWVQQLQAIFTDLSIDAVSGVMHYEVPLAPLVDKIDLHFRRSISRQLRFTDTVFLQGANMAIRTHAWRMSRKHMCRKGSMHEDFDLAIHVQECGFRVVFDERLHAVISARRIDTGFLDFAHYVSRSSHTYAQHQLPERRHMYGAMLFSLLVYMPARIMVRGYCNQRQTFSFWRALLPRETAARTNPTIVK